MYFSDIIGLNNIKEHLTDSVNRGHIPHARIIQGASGVGKLLLAIAYSRYLMCENRSANDSCGVCPSCQKIDKLAHPDLHFVFPVIKSKTSDEYLPQWRDFLSKNKYFDLNDWLEYIDAENAQGLIYSKESEEIIRKLNLKVYEAPYKVMIVWLPEKMHESCANKLLKLIEEPPANTIFLLVTEDAENVITTIRSRCQPLNVRGLDMKEVLAGLQINYGLDENAAISVAHIARGSFTKAIKIIQSNRENNYNFDLFKKMMRASVIKNIRDIKVIASELASIGREKQKSYILNSLRLFREYFISNLNAPQMVYLNSEEQDFGIKFAPFINDSNIEAFDDEFQTAYRQIEQNGNARIIFLDLCLKCTMLLKK